MAKETWTAKTPDRGPQFDRFERRSNNPHGPLSDAGYNSQPGEPHGPHFDEGLGDRSKAGDDFERALQKVPSRIRSMDAGCPACGHRHHLEDALRAGHATGKRSDDDVDVMKDVREADEAFMRDGAGNADELHQALVASINKTYGLPSSATVAKTKKAADRPARRTGEYAEAAEILRRRAGIKT